MYISVAGNWIILNETSRLYLYTIKYYTIHNKNKIKKNYIMTLNFPHLDNIVGKTLDQSKANLVLIIIDHCDNFYHRFVSTNGGIYIFHT